MDLQPRVQAPKLKAQKSTYTQESLKTQNQKNNLSKLPENPPTSDGIFLRGPLWPDAQGRTLGLLSAFRGHMIKSEGILEAYFGSKPNFSPSRARYLRKTRECGDLGVTRLDNLATWPMKSSH